MQTTANRTRPAKSKSLDILKSISQLTKQKNALDAQIAEAEKALFESMKMHDEQQVTDLGTGDVAKVAEQFTRTKTEVSVRDLQKALNESDFFECVTVSLTNCRKFMSENELRGISKVTDPVSNGLGLQVKLK